MRAPLSWLRDYAPLDAPPARLAEVLSELGLVVESTEHVGEGLDDVVVARVLDIRAHPAADRIRLVDVDAGDGEALQIVCGAWNFAVGDLVPLAPVGAVLPGGFAIGRRKMRGEVSNGMLCSAPELGLPGPGDGLLVLPPGSAAPGVPFAEAMGLEPDVVFDLDVGPNRPDALCMAGVARDLAAALGEAWSWPAGPPAPPVDPSIGTAPLSVDAPDLCPRFTATVLDGAPTGPSPVWMARRLTLAGMRPIGAVVDVSNYVMLDVGQPNHAYDLDALGGGGLSVRRARPGERLVTLDGVERALGPDDCLICDAGGTPVGVGGVMGGAGAEIDPSTTRVLLEAAWFAPAAIARTGQRLGLHSEARVRFERGVDPELAPRAVERFAGLLASLPGGEALRRGATVDARSPHLPGRPRVALRTSRVNDLLGTALSEDDLPRLLRPLGFRLEDPVGGTFDVEVPSWRLECSREVDLIEEVARMWGYRRIERTVPAGSRRRTGGLTAFQRERRRIRQVLSGAGFYEAWTSTFLAPGDLGQAGLDPLAVEVENPLDRSESVLRTSLLPGLLKALRFNLDRQNEDLALFEVGRVFAPPADEGSLPVESERLGVVVLPFGAADASTAVAAAVRCWVWVADALRLDGASIDAAELPGLHPSRAARLLGPSGTILGEVGEVASEAARAYGIDGRVGWLGLSLDAVFGEARRPRLAADVSRYPASALDLAFVAGDDLPAARLAGAIAGAAGDLLEDLVLFDVYRDERLGAGRRSLAYHVTLRAADRTLDEPELAELRRAMIAAASAEGGELRGEPAG
ncbi:MAG TPA: phenylalanine--tRNA ligase subunit beta [Acidimicrobiales bacterium]|nr:phenylalanine--tRNA ligase subunit beta [Acidimicrobiales bacterium]